MARARDGIFGGGRMVGDAKHVISRHFRVAEMVGEEDM